MGVQWVVFIHGVIDVDKMPFTVHIIWFYHRWVSLNMFTICLNLSTTVRINVKKAGHVYSRVLFASWVRQSLDIFRNLQGVIVVSERSIEFKYNIQPITWKSRNFKMCLKLHVERKISFCITKKTLHNVSAVLTETRC